MKKLKDGEWHEVPGVEVSQMACCDCGLVHDIVYVLRNGRLYRAAWRNDRLTKKRRKKRGHRKRSNL
jgi:hypothetical protein